MAFTSHENHKSFRIGVEKFATAIQEWGSTHFQVIVCLKLPSPKLSMDPHEPDSDRCKYEQDLEIIMFSNETICTASTNAYEHDKCALDMLRHEPRLDLRSKTKHRPRIHKVCLESAAVLCMFSRRADGPQGGSTTRRRFTSWGFKSFAA